MSTEDHEAVVRAYWGAAEARDWDAFAAALSPDVGGGLVARTLRAAR